MSKNPDTKPTPETDEQRAMDKARKSVTQMAIMSVLAFVAVVFTVTGAYSCWRSWQFREAAEADLEAAQTKLDEAQEYYDNAAAYQSHGQLFDQVANLSYDLIRWVTPSGEEKLLACQSVQIDGPFELDEETEWFTKLEKGYEDYVVAAYAETEGQMLYNYRQESASDKANLYTCELMEVDGYAYKIEAKFTEVDTESRFLDWRISNREFKINLEFLKGHNNTSQEKTVRYDDENVIYYMDPENVAPCGCTNCCCEVCKCAG